MKRSLRLPFTLLLLALLTLLSTRSTMLDSLISIPASLPKPVIHLNHTLLSLASLDSSEPQLKQQVHNLLNVIEYKPATHYLTRYRIPADRLLFTNFRSALLTWIHTRYFHAQIMSDLIRLVKRPIDVHFARPESEYTKPYPSCAVVGNSGILLKKENGDFIDGHDVVIRLNNAEIRSHAKHVGSKTNISFVNSNILHLCARRTGCFCHPYGKDVVIVMYICQPIHFFDFVNCNMLHKSPLLITDPRFDVMCARVVKYYSLKRFVEGGARGLEEWGEVHDERMFHYSSGMQAVVMALGICERVSVFGFGKSRDVKHHYHTNQKAELGLHDYGAEYEFYRDLVERPEVIPFLNQSGFVVPPVVFYH